VVHRVIAHNPDTFWGIAPRESFTRAKPCATGYLAFLPLTEEGVHHLVRGTLKGTDPDLSLITRQNEKPAGIYFWGVYAPGLGDRVVPLGVQKMSTPLYHDVDFYSRPITRGGVRVVEQLNFERGVTLGGTYAPDLYVYRRSGVETETRPIYDTYRPGQSHAETSITVARTLEDLLRVVSVRSAVYIAEQRCPYDEEFDGNDFCGSHLLGYAGDEPVGCLRIRYFAGFAQLERLAVRQEFRSRRLGTLLMQAGIEFCRAKGYRVIYGRGRKEILGYYKSLGFRTLEGGRELSFSDHRYVEIVYEEAPRNDAIALGIDPYVLMRPEGRWDKKGILEESAARAMSDTPEDVAA
jgi:predicted GNAT family N-acyltransferase